MLEINFSKIVVLIINFLQFHLWKTHFIISAFKFFFNSLKLTCQKFLLVCLVLLVATYKFFLKTPMSMILLVWFFCCRLVFKVKTFKTFCVLSLRFMNHGPWLVEFSTIEDAWLGLLFLKPWQAFIEFSITKTIKGSTLERLIIFQFLKPFGFIYFPISFGYVNFIITLRFIDFLVPFEFGNFLIPLGFIDSLFQ